MVEVILDGLVAEAFALRRKRTRTGAGTAVEAERPASPGQRYVSIPQQRAATQPANSQAAVRSLP